MKPIAWIDPNDNMSDPFSWNKTSYHTVPLYTAPQCDGCGNCHTCLVGVMENNMPVTSQRMIVCSDCGNKRCPKASNHRHKCTGSNEVGQYGSIYTAPRELMTTIVKDEQGKVVAVTLTNEQHQVQEVLWEAPRELSDEEIIEIGNAVVNLIDSNEGWIEFAKAILKKGTSEMKLPKFEADLQKRKEPDYPKDAVGYTITLSDGTLSESFFTVITHRTFENDDAIFLYTTPQIKELSDEEILEELFIPKSEWEGYKAQVCLKQVRAILKKASEK